MKEKPARILIVDDEKNIRRILMRLLKNKGFTVAEASDGESALGRIAMFRPDVVLLDLVMPKMKGMEVLKRLKTHDPDLAVVMITAHGGVQSAVEAMRLGAHDYIAKPFEHEEVVRVVHRAVAERRLKQKVTCLTHQLGNNLDLAELMGPSDQVRHLVVQVNQVAKSNFTVVIIGETGAGKELVAQTIHRASPRCDGPFFAVDCGAIPDTLLESELFGHEKGAFTSAVQKKRGKFEAAGEGTLFLDEIVNMALKSQAKLLRAIQEKKICPVGGEKSLTIQARLLTACNRNLEDSVAAGIFREDLYYRLNEFTIKIPALRERKEDIPYLAKRFLDSTNMELDKKVMEFSERALDRLLAYNWPGNVRQLRSVIRRAVLLADDVISERHLNIHSKTICQRADPKPLDEMLCKGHSLKDMVRLNSQSLEREILTKVLKTTGGNKAKAARMLQIDYKTIQTKIKRLAIKPTKTGEQRL